MKLKGLREIYRELETAVRHGGSLTIVVSTDFFLTEPAALWQLFDLYRKHQSVSAYMVKSGEVTFHPKVYCAVKGRRVHMIVGSANLTTGGLGANFELSLLRSTDVNSQEYRDFGSWIDLVIKEKRVIRLNRVAIELYESKYDIFHRMVKSAERKARKEIERQSTIDTPALQRCVKEYLKDRLQRSNWEEKQERYKHAKSLLVAMLAQPPKNKSEFIGIYGTLVGKKGAGSLWHSGSIFRSKNRVADSFKEFAIMLSALNSAVGKAPETVFALGLSHKDKISGLGPNVLTEILNTFSPSEYPVLNKNPIGSLRDMDVAEFQDPSLFTPETYAKYAQLMGQIASRYNFKDLSHVDHFMNYVYWKYVKNRS
jgi:HKD family nuclease